MKLKLSLLLVIFLAFSSQALAQDIQGKWGLGLRIGGSFFTQDINDDDPTATVEGDPGLALNATAAYGITRNLSLGVMLDWNRNNVSKRLNQ